MTFNLTGNVLLDNGTAATAKLLANLSGVASIGESVWTVSDEGRTVECLRQNTDGYRLHAQFELDDLIEAVPRADHADELGLESVDICDGHLWLCGSHCRVRAEPDADDELNAALRNRPSRQWLARIRLKNHGGDLADAVALPFKGESSLRHQLASDAYLSPFLELPSKENGFDVEGLAVSRDHVHLDLRGPLVHSIAVVVSLNLTPDFQIKSTRTLFVDLCGLGIRELVKEKDSILILAGPVSSARGPFRLYCWKPQPTRKIQRPLELLTWPESSEKPEGLCIIDRGDRRELLVVYDSQINRVGSTARPPWPILSPYHNEYRAYADRFASVSSGNRSQSTSKLAQEATTASPPPQRWPL
ncbi:DUF3616 domain-containing protein [Microvirga sp. VF16]|uniref:DUF3616 domain-containing protein n=1 Tax=Microvirga sp. VF16 TaxID=2807101 RepID=UPI00193C9639|nr:DUF3616 domain-containing protein [Microvirga sp. VF16]QRM32533.1 DUF3616 domain-containing protein [Microvirga sp. VF16]